MRKLTLLLSAIILLNSGCAVIFTGAKQKVTFKSNAQGTVYQNLTAIGKTNEEIKIKRKDLVKLYTIKSDGCTDKSIELPIKTNPAFYLNYPIIFAFGYGLLTSYVDVVYGAEKKTDKIINVDIQCKGK